MKEEKLTASDSTVEDVPRSYSERVRIFICDLAIAFVVLSLMRPLFLIVFGCDLADFATLVKNHPKIVKFCMWPATGVVLTLFFRDVLMRILYQIPDFVSRSQYGNPVVPATKSVDPPDFEDKPSISTSATTKESASKVSERSPGVSSRMTVEEGQHAALLALNRIEAEYGCKMEYEARIRGTPVVFDGIMRDGELIYGVEVKCGYNHASIDRVLKRFSELFATLPPKLRDRFTPILCVVAQQPDEEWKEELRQTVLQRTNRVVLKMYSKDELFDYKTKGCLPGKSAK